MNEEFNLGEGTVRDWIKQFCEECREDPQTNDLGKLYEENRRLRREFAESQKEVSFLKKA